MSRFAPAASTDTDSTSRGTVLVLSPGIDVFGPSQGAQYRTYNVADQLRDKGWEVVILDYGSEGSDREEFDVYNFENLVPPRLNDFNPDLYRKLYRIFRTYDVDVVHVKALSGVMAAKLVATALGTGSKVVYDAQYAEGVTVQQYVEPTLPAWKRVLIPYAIPRLERNAISFADLVVAVSDDDIPLFLDAYDVDREKFRFVPSGIHASDLDALTSREEIRREYGLSQDETLAVFLGKYDYFPNREAIELIRERLAPAMRETHPDLTFVIAGKGVPAFEEENVVGLGYVEDLQSFLHAMDIGLVPLRHGGGTKIKIFDYMDVGLPIVSTAKGTEGIALVDGESAMVAEDVDEGFVENVAALAEKPDERERLGRNARELAVEKYNWDAIGEDLSDLYARLGEQ